MNATAELKLMRKQLDALNDRLASPFTPNIEATTSRIKRIIKKRQQLASEQLDYFRLSLDSGEEFSADYLSVISFELAILEKLDDLLTQIIVASSDGCEA